MHFHHAFLNLLIYSLIEGWYYGSFCCARKIAEIKVENNRAYNGALAQEFEVLKCDHRLMCRVKNQEAAAVYAWGLMQYYGVFCESNKKSATYIIETAKDMGSLEAKYFYENFILKEINKQNTNVSSSTSSSNESSYNSSSSNGGCYVATCVYGSYDCPQVWTLRRYRDDILSTTWYGRTFIKVYYAVSPTIVRLFGSNKWFKNIWKPRLDKLVYRLNEQGVSDKKYYDKEE